MSNGPFPQARFLLSAPGRQFWPKDNFDEVILLGRSNVGKSSFINALAGNKKLAMVSSTPGRTRLLNFYALDETLILVDAPGYGFTASSKDIGDPWNSMVKDYLLHRSQMKAAIVCLDGRRVPSQLDGVLLNFLQDHERRVGFVITKMDTLNQSEKGTLISRMRTMIPYFTERPILYSEKDPLKWQHLVLPFFNTLLHR